MMVTFEIADVESAITLKSGRRGFAGWHPKWMREHLAGRTTATDDSIALDAPEHRMVSRVTFIGFSVSGPIMTGIQHRLTSMSMHISDAFTN